MHEMSIAVTLVEQVVEIAERNSAMRIGEINVTIGEMRHVIPDAMACAFREASLGTVAEGATLNVTPERIGAVCGECGRHYQPVDSNFCCPECGAANARIVAGDDIVLESIVCEVQTAGGVA